MNTTKPIYEPLEVEILELRMEAGCFASGESDESAVYSYSTVKGATVNTTFSW